MTMPLMKPRKKNPVLRTRQMNLPPWARGRTALGMTAGAWTVVMASLRCPHAAAMHCVVAHVVPTLILTALGAMLGWLLLRVRATPRI